MAVIEKKLTSAKVLKMENLNIYKEQSRKKSY